MTLIYNVYPCLQSTTSPFCASVGGWNRGNRFEIVPVSNGCPTAPDRFHAPLEPVIVSETLLVDQLHSFGKRQYLLPPYFHCVERPLKVVDNRKQARQCRFASILIRSFSSRYVYKCINSALKRRCESFSFRYISFQNRQTYFRYFFCWRSNPAPVTLSVVSSFLTYL